MTGVLQNQSETHSVSTLLDKKSKQKQNPIAVIERLEEKYGEIDGDKMKDLFIKALCRDEQTTALVHCMKSLPNIEISALYGLLCNQAGDFKNHEEAMVAAAQILKEIEDIKNNNVKIATDETKSGLEKMGQLQNIAYKEKTTLLDLVQKYMVISDKFVGTNPYAWTEKELAKPAVFVPEVVVEQTQEQQPKESKLLSFGRKLFSGAKNNSPAPKQKSLPVYRPDLSDYKETEETLAIKEAIQREKNDGSTYLSLEVLGLTVSMAKAIAGFKGLTRLYIKSSARTGYNGLINDDALTIIGSIPTLTSLRFCNFKLNKQNIEELRHNKTLTCLDVSACKNHDYKVFDILPEMKNLTSTNLFTQKDSPSNKMIKNILDIGNIGFLGQEISSKYPKFIFENNQTIANDIISKILNDKEVSREEILKRGNLIINKAKNKDNVDDLIKVIEVMSEKIGIDKRQLFRIAARNDLAGDKEGKYFDENPVISLHDLWQEYDQGQLDKIKPQLNQLSQMTSGQISDERNIDFIRFFIENERIPEAFKVLDFSRQVALKLIINNETEMNQRTKHKVEILMKEAKDYTPSLFDRLSHKFGKGNSR